jgi:predicted dithiol-disulfide oxidoreductase (DUF899 family)
MFAPDWKAGCPHCSRWADNFNGVIVQGDRGPFWVRRHDEYGD